jgi:hypothetical protein
MKCIHCGKPEDLYLYLNPEGECPICIENQRDDLLELLKDSKTVLLLLKDDTPCRLDHHGSCQTHTLQIPCEQALLRKLLVKIKKIIK